ncbi:MAG: cell division protein FtsK, partial [Microvirga sp.]|nr:cell division protein FtsK [Microvirga sp.]
MRPNHQPAPCPQTSPDSRPTEPKLPKAGGPSAGGIQESAARAWKTPWSEAGLPEPGWWRAFAVDTNVRSTRTPRRVAPDQATIAAKASAIVEAVTKTLEPRPIREEATLLAERAEENAVRSRIADLHSAFRPEPSRHDEEGTDTAGDGQRLDARIKALQDAARVDREPPIENAPLLTRSRGGAARRQVVSTVDQAEVAEATASFGWMERTYAVEILSLDGSYDFSVSAPAEGFEMTGIAEAGAAHSTMKAGSGCVSGSALPPVLSDETTPQSESTVVEAPANSPEVDADFLWLYDSSMPIPTASIAPEPEVDEPVVRVPEITMREVVVRTEVPVVRPSTQLVPFVRHETTGEGAYELPDLAYLAEAPKTEGPVLTEDILEESAGHLEKVIRDFGVKGEIIHVRPGPVVTLYEFEPAPGTKSARVVALADDIARSMSAVSARVAVIPGRNAIGIELPNETRDTVYLREQLESDDFKASRQKLPLCLGKTIGGEPVIADLARMPHLLVAGTTGSGKSVAINTMILSLLYRFTPEQCRLIMVDPKMLELSVYDGIPHLLTPVVTDPKKAIIALRWAVREMEDRYKKMSKLGVRNIDGFNVRVSEAKAKGEVITRTVQTGFEKETGQAVYEDEIMDLEPLPYIVV